jgi:hypothetical protein
MARSLLNSCTTPIRIASEIQRSDNGLLGSIDRFACTTARGSMRGSMQCEERCEDRCVVIMARRRLSLRLACTMARRLSFRVACTMERGGCPLACTAVAWLVRQLGGGCRLACMTARRRLSLGLYDTTARGSIRGCEDRCEDQCDARIDALLLWLLWLSRAQRRRSMPCYYGYYSTSVELLLLL